MFDIVHDIDKKHDIDKNEKFNMWDRRSPKKSCTACWQGSRLLPKKVVDLISPEVFSLVSNMHNLLETPARQRAISNVTKGW